MAQLVEKDRSIMLKTLQKTVKLATASFGTT